MTDADSPRATNTDAQRRPDRIALVGGIGVAVAVGIVIGVAITKAADDSRPIAAAPTTVTSTVTSTVAAPQVPVVAAPETSLLQPPEHVPVSYSGTNRVLSVGDTPRGGLTSAIPPGRYAVTIIDGESGAWMRCRSELCGLAYMENILAIENARGPGYSAVMEVEPSDVAIALHGVTLTPVE